MANKANKKRTNDATREDVIMAIGKCNGMGVDEFLRAHGYRASLKYQIRFFGKLYPSKAILGVACGLTAREFSGGAAHTVRVLHALGFEVVEVSR